MFTLDPEELQLVCAGLEHDARLLGVGIVHLPSRRIRLNLFACLPHAGGHAEWVELCKIPFEECRGFVIARPHEECVIVNVSQLNMQHGSLQMANETFRDVLSTLRTCRQRLKERKSVEQSS